MRSLGGVDDSLKNQLINDFQSADITHADKLILNYAAKITREPHLIDQAFVDHLKSNDFSDRLIHDIVQVAAYFNYINRLADGLGVEMEG